MYIHKTSSSILCGVEVMDDVGLFMQCVRVLELFHKLRTVDAFVHLLVHRRYVFRRLVLALQVRVRHRLLYLAPESARRHCSTRTWNGVRRWATATRRKIHLTICSSTTKQVTENRFTAKKPKNTHMDNNNLENCTKNSRLREGFSCRVNVILPPETQKHLRQHFFPDIMLWWFCIFLMWTKIVSAI